MHGREGRCAKHRRVTPGRYRAYLGHPMGENLPHQVVSFALGAATSAPMRPTGTTIGNLGRRAVRLLALVSLLSSCRAAAPLGPQSPPDPTLDKPIGIETQLPSELDQRLAELSETLEAARVEHHVPGMAIAVVKDDAMVFARGFGNADLEGGTEVTPETLFSIGSSTKAFTATLVGMQAEAAALSFDDPVSKYVPQFKLGVDSKNKDATVTIRDALCHRSGFTRMSLLWASGKATRSDVLSQASRAESWAKYRSKFLYNNVMYLAAGEAAARSAQMNWEDLLLQKLLGPLGMTDTTPSLERVLNDERRAQGYRWRTVPQAFEAVPPRDLDNIAPAGSIFSNVLDMSKWLRVQLAEGELDGRQIIPAAVVAETHTQQFEIAKGNGYGLGWFIDKYEGKTVVHHGGNIDGYSAMVAMIPEEELGFVILFNVSVSPLQNLSRGLVFDALLGDKTPAVGSTEDFSNLVGVFIANFGPFKDAKFSVTEKDGKLFVDVPGQMNYELAAPNDDGRRPFAMTDTVAVSFEQQGEGPAEVMRMHQGGLDFELMREGYKPPPEIPLAELERFKGSYRNDDGMVVPVVVQNNRLAVDIPKQMVFELRAPDDKGLRAFRVKPDIAVEFVGKGPDTMRLHEKGKVVDFKRVAATKAGKLPTVAALQKKRRVAKLERALEGAGYIEVHGRVRMVHTGVEGDLRMVYGEGHVHMTMDFGRFGRIDEVVTPEGAWSQYPASPLEVHKGKFLTQARLGVPLKFLMDWNDTFDEVNVLRRGSLDGRDTVQVQMKAAELDPYVVTVAADNGDVLQVEYSLMLDGPGSIPNTLRMDDYRTTLGIRAPRRYSLSNDSAGRTEWTIDTIERFKGDPNPEFRPPTTPPKNN